jgi:hypothetical protein
MTANSALIRLPTRGKENQYWNRATSVFPAHDAANNHISVKKTPKHAVNARTYFMPASL